MTIPCERPNGVPDLLAEAAAAAAPAPGASSPGWWSSMAAPWASIGTLMPWAGWAPLANEGQEPDLVENTGMIAARHVGAQGTRAYAVFVPPQARVEALPVIMMLHGCKQHPADFARGTGMNRWAQRVPCIVVYPQQTARHNGLRCWNWFDPQHQRRDAGEPALLAGILLEVLATYGGDPRRVYVAGLSAGGAMAAVMARTYPDLIAAAAVHSGLPADVAHNLPDAMATMRGGHERGVRDAQQRGLQEPARSHPPVPMIVLQGGADRTVDAINAQRLIDLHLPHAHAGRTVQSRAGEPGHERAVTQTVWLNPRGQVVGELWTVPDAGHAWFGGDPSGSYTDPNGPDASGEILRFFMEHPRTGR